MLWGSLGALFECFSGFGGRATAKTPKTLDLITSLVDLLCFEGPKASKIKSKWSPTREREGEKREKSREERDESATEAKSGRSSCLSTFPGSGGGSKLDDPGGSARCQGVGF